MSNQPVIHWFRRDLRLRDNLALHAACASDAPVIPLFIIDTTLLQAERIGAPRLKFLLNALRALDARLQEYGTNLLVRHGNPQEILPALVDEVNAQALHCNRDYSPYARNRDRAITEELSIPVHMEDDLLLLKPGTICKSDGDPYIVYTYFWKKWQKTPKPAISTRHFREEWFYDLDGLPNDGIPTMQDLGFDDVDILPEASENHARDVLQAFIEKDITQYDTKRDYLPINPFAEERPTGTSYLSPYLRLGLLSPRQAYWAARNAYEENSNKDDRDSITTWVSELAWREFYTHILYFFPHVLERDFVDTYLGMAWRDPNTDPHAHDDLEAWKNGQTGYPVVDAAMRQLKEIGWMPNRARMIVASFLTKDLLIHWKHGDVHFMKYLLDGDPAANNGGWQWAAGTGTDAQPYFRIFNPVSQSEKYATEAYLKHWIPELRQVSSKYIHAPWEMNNPPKAYPAPIVDHKEARENTLEAFKAARETN